MALVSGCLLFAVWFTVGCCWPMLQPVPSSSSSSGGGGGGDAGVTAKILAVFDSSELDTMNRVMQKTLVSLNKERPAWSGSHRARGDPLLEMKKKASSDGARVRAPVVHSAVYSSEWWANQTADDLAKVFAAHQPVALLVLASDERAVYRVALAAGLYHLPVVGARVQRGLDDASFQVSAHLPTMSHRLLSVVCAMCNCPVLTKLTRGGVQLPGGSQSGTSQTGKLLLKPPLARPPSLKEGCRNRPIESKTRSSASRTCPTLYLSPKH